MSDLPTTDRSQLSKQHAHVRRCIDRNWLVTMCVILLASTVGWFFTSSVYWLIGGMLYAAIPLIGLIHNHFFVLNSNSDPVQTQQRLEARAEQQRTRFEKLQAKQRKNSRTVLFWNGSMFVVISPIMFLGGVVRGAQDHGVWGAILGGLLGCFWLASGIGAIVWSRRFQNV